MANLGLCEVEKIIGWKPNIQADKMTVCVSCVRTSVWILGLLLFAAKPSYILKYAEWWEQCSVYFGKYWSFVKVGSVFLDYMIL